MIGIYESDNSIVEPVSYTYISEEQANRLWPVQMDILEAFNLIDQKANLESINEVSYKDIVDKEIFKVEVMDIDRFIKVNNVQEISNPTFFGTSGAPTPDGLLSNEIFGITQADRSGIFGYIDLVEYFIDPSCYKTLIRLNRKFQSVILGTQRYSIGPAGELVEDPTGGTGIKWLKENFDKLSFEKPDSNRRRDIKVEYIKRNYEKGKMFINKYVVIPPYYRDVNTTGKYTGVGQINKLYVNLIVAAAALRENNNYGLSMADTTCARVQETLKAIYDWFCGNENSTIVDKGTGMSGKFGILKRANISKTSDYSSRLVMSAPELKVESADDLMVNLDKSAAPLAAVTADFYPFMMFHIRRFFEEEFLNVSEYPVYVDGKVVYAPLKNAMLTFNDDMIKKQLKQFLYSYDNRFVPIEAPIDYNAINVDRNKTIYYMMFKGTKRDSLTGKASSEPITTRPLTWVDVIYMAAMKSVEGKVMSFTRYPYDTLYNTIYTGIEVSSTKETEPVYINGALYKFYPKIREHEIGRPTKDKFVDTMQICNLYLKGMGGDYDGDTGVMKGSFFNETNEELKKFMNSKINYIDLACKNIRLSSNEAVQSIYNLTKVLYTDKDTLTQPEF